MLHFCGNIKRGCHFYPMILDPNCPCLFVYGHIFLRWYNWIVAVCFFGVGRKFVVCFFCCWLVCFLVFLDEGC